MGVLRGYSIIWSLLIYFEDEAKAYAIASYSSKFAGGGQMVILPISLNCFTVFTMTYNKYVVFLENVPNIVAVPSYLAGMFFRKLTLSRITHWYKKSTWLRVLTYNRCGTLFFFLFKSRAKLWRVTFYCFIILKFMLLAYKISIELSWCAWYTILHNVHRLLILLWK